MKRTPQTGIIHSMHRRRIIKRAFKQSINKQTHTHAYIHSPTNNLIMAAGGGRQPRNHKLYIMSLQKAARHGHAFTNHQAKQAQISFTPHEAHDHHYSFLLAQIPHRTSHQCVRSAPSDQCPNCARYRKNES